MTDDSDQDFELCPRLLKRVRRRGGGGGGGCGDERKRSRTKEEDDDDEEEEEEKKSKAPSVRGRSGRGRAQRGGRSLLARGSAQGQVEEGVKEKVVRRMQQFRRAAPPRLLPSSGHTEDPPSTEADEVLALRLQQQWDSEAQVSSAADDQDGGLFICQLCHKDLSAMSPQLRTQHINRCLDKSENGGSVAQPPPPAPPPPAPPRHARVPECPICGQGFRSEKSRASHLKRCSASMGVSPVELLQALQRQAAESRSASVTDQPVQAGGSRAPDVSVSGVPVQKKIRKRAPRMDEDTMVALALSRSLLEQEKERERDREEERQIQAQLSSAPAASAPVLQWRAGAGKSRGKRKKGVAPPPLLLLQDPQSAQNRIQERVSALLLRSRPPSPPTPTLPPSKLPSATPSTCLWLKSALPGGGPHSVSEFYTAELSAFIQPWVPPEKRPSLSSGVTPVKQRPPSAPGSPVDPEQLVSTPLDQRAEEQCDTPLSLTSTLGTQALQDLVELAEEGMTLTQYAKADAAGAELPLSGFVPEAAELTKPPTNSMSVSRLCCDLGSMVNNPQLSDVQLQVDSGDVYYAHAFMLYTRCPLLANMVHDAGFGVQEEGFPPAQRVLLGEVPGEAVYALLQYLYTAVCPLTHTLLPHILQLATRFGLSELRQQCEQYSGDSEVLRGEVCGGAQESPVPQQSLAESQFLELLRSMWQHEGSDEEEAAEGAKRGVEEEEGGERVEGELSDDRVDEDELDEIYEFAATQKRMETGAEAGTESGDEEESEEEGEGVNECTDVEKRDEGEQKGKPTEGGDQDVVVTSPPASRRNASVSAEVCLDSKSSEVALDRSYSRLFSDSWGEYVEPAQTPPPPSQPNYANGRTPRTPRTPWRLSSVSEVIDLSISPPPGSREPSSLPVPGVSPGVGGAPDQGGARQQVTTSLSSAVDSAWSERPAHIVHSETRSAASPSVPRSTKPKLSAPEPDSSVTQPELIVLSDSSEDTEHEVFPPGRTGSSPSPPRSQTSTQVTAPESLDSRLGVSPRRSPPAPSHTSTSTKHPNSGQEGAPLPAGGGESVLDGSAEVSWLIPATPEPSTCTGSTQTHSSMRCIRLFPISRSSSSSSSPADRSKAVPRSSHTLSRSLKDRELSMRPQLNLSSSREGSSSSLPNTLQSHTSGLPAASPAVLMKRACPLPTAPSEPCSSTPLHSDPPLKPPDPLGSPLLRDAHLGPQSPVRAVREFSPGFGSLRLSLSQSLPSRHRRSEEEEEVCERSSPCPSLGDRGAAQMERESMSEVETKEEERRGSEEEEENRGRNESGKVEEGGSDLRCSSFVLDEPPMAFDDSWGLDRAVEDPRPRFSLRLDSSEGVESPPEGSGQIETAAPRAPPHTTPPLSGAPLNHTLPDPEAWDSWEEEKEEEEAAALPLSQRVGGVALAKRVAQLKTPVARKKNNNNAPLVPITPMPGFSDMDTPELKNRLDRFGVRPLPKKQMVLKLKEIHQYTHQLMSSESEEEASPRGRPRAPPALQPTQLSFKQPTAPPPVSPRRLQFGEEEERDGPPASQESNTSSTAESDRSNPELCDSDGDGSDSEGFTASQSAAREKDKLLAVRSFIRSDPLLYGRVLRYQPLALSELKAKLRVAGIRLGTAKLLDFLDSQCITFTTAQQGQSGPSRGRGRARVGGGRGRKRAKTSEG